LGGDRFLVLWKYSAHGGLPDEFSDYKTFGFCYNPIFKARSSRINIEQITFAAGLRFNLYLELYTFPDFRASIKKPETSK